MSPKSSLTGPSGKRQPSKRTITARNEMRFSHLYHEYEEDDHDWSKEKETQGYFSSKANTHSTL